jgi:hypothetical protein
MILVVPSVRALTTPSDVTVATAGVTDVQVTLLTVVPSGVLAVSWLVAPMLRIVWPVILSTVAAGVGVGVD